MLDRRSFLRAGVGAAVAGGLVVSRGGGSPGVAPGDPALPWGALRAKLRGRLVLPADPDYDRAKQLQLAQYDVVRPRAVAYCADSADVAACVTFAREHGITATPRSGGHSGGGYSTSEGLVVDVSSIKGVARGASTVRVGAGAQGIDILVALDRHHIQVATGTCPTVGLGGYLQGGGHGAQSRKFGMACDRLVSATVVLSDGRVVQASERENADLHWAVRGGGGGNFGIVTEFEVLPTSVPSMVDYTLAWAWSDAVDVLDAWQGWGVTGPRELDSTLGIARVGAAEPQLTVKGAYLGPKAACDALLDRLVRMTGRSPLSRTATELSYTDAMKQTYGCSTTTVEQCHRIGYSPGAQLPRDNHTSARNRFLARPLSDTAVRAALTAFEADPVDDHLHFLNLLLFGGRINDLSRTATGYVHRDAEFALGYGSVVLHGGPDADEIATAQRWVGHAFDVIDPHSNGESYQNYIDPDLEDWRTAYYGENTARLQAVKRRYDPRGLFTFAQSI